MFEILPQSILLISLVISFVFIVLGVGLIVLRVFNFTKDLLEIVEKNNNREAEQIKADAILEATKILDDARASSINTIRETNDKATQILSEAGSLSQESRTKLVQLTEDFLKNYQSQLSQMSSQYITQYEDLLKNKSSVDLDHTNNVLAQLQTDLDTQIQSFESSFATNLSNLTNTLSQTVKEKYETADIDIEKYKKERLTKIDENIYKILELVSVQVLGKAVDLSDLETFIEGKLKEQVIGVK